MRPVFISLAVLVGLAACERTDRDAPPARSPSAAQPSVSVKATQAMALINAEVEPLIWDSSVNGSLDRGTLEIELHSLDGPWRWWSRQRRVLGAGDSWSGIFGDVSFTVAPEDLRLPAEVVQGADDRWDVVLTCRDGPCFRMSGSEAQAQGTRAEVEAALDRPSPVDNQIDAVFFPFRTQAQAERVSTAMNELLALQGASGG